jgi:hypothetical protein
VEYMLDFFWTRLEAWFQAVWCDLVRHFRSHTVLITGTAETVC